MKTRVLTITDPEEDIKKIQEAADLIRAGEAVAFPTETVYGLGANALEAEAVRKIFEAKGRPGDNPLIVHIYDVNQWKDLVEDIPKQALLLAEAFWPGPLSIILKKSSLIPEEVTAGLDTVGVRMPAHPAALKLLALAGVPVAAPSANRSGKPSPTTAGHVLEDLNGRIPMILDGGSSCVGVESTVLDCTGEVPLILRPGGVTPEMLREKAGQVRIHSSVRRPLFEDEKAISPGMKYVHYAPNAPVVLIRGSVYSFADYVNRKALELEREGKKAGILATEQSLRKCRYGIRLSLGDGNNPSEIAGNLFACLREFDSLGVDLILAEAVEEKGIGLAVMNRIVKAAGFHVIDLES
ncbi:MAG: threonylcarbamoyl-AMP synthase [Clostridiales bacterium]|nr:threonylcarbamoyl-AMP synthase [Clostridiales bacterium]